ncbi:MAG: TolC family protein, partial [Terriglobales bacterium]
MRTALVILAMAAAATAQTAVPPAPPITLAQAIQLARVNSPQFQATLVAEGVAGADQATARAGLLPSLNYNTSAIYTQAGRYIANNGVHEYSSQGNLHEAVGFGSLPTLQRAQAGVALARAQAEVASRGLVAAVVGSYYTLTANAHKVATAELAVNDAQKYLSISQDRERGGEVAHADVIKAQIELQQKQRDLHDAQLAQKQSKLTLAVLLFPNFTQDFTVVDDLNQPPPL